MTENLCFRSFKIDGRKINNPRYVDDTTDIKRTTDETCRI